ncbi:MAG: ECF transporter S component [Candidatus Bathyarchaeota archaeon]|nr:MAG: ECF transporter S component [Candidatus Bathyarchaeota archaeon]
MKNRASISPIRIAITAVFTSLVFVSTTIFSIYVPQTRGFFNIGETMVYTTAVLFGPIIGAFAGGFGSMLADLFLGYPHYALATLVIKACEGAVVGALTQKRMRFGSKLQWKIFTITFSLIAGVLLAAIGSLYYSGSVELYIGFPPPETPTLILFVPKEFWYSLGVLVILLVSLVGFVFEPELGWHVFSILLGGSLMVIGYFLYQQFFLGVLAIVEIPVNIGQMVIGLVLAIPIVRALRRSLPSTKT